MTTVTIQLAGTQGAAFINAGFSDWAAATAYIANDGVADNGSSWRCKLAHTSSASNRPGTSGGATYWQRFASAGATNGLPFVLDLSSTTMADPGPGKARFNALDLTAATKLALAAESAATGNPDVSGQTSRWSSGSLSFVDLAGPETRIDLTVTAATDHGAWIEIDLTAEDTVLVGTFVDGDSAAGTYIADASAPAAASALEAAGHATTALGYKNDAAASALAASEDADQTAADRVATEAAKDLAVTAAASVAGPLVVVAGGQSNMDGSGAGGTKWPENDNVKFFDPQTRAFRNISYTNRLQRTSVNDGNTTYIPYSNGDNNLAFSFCHIAHQETGRDVYLIINSNGGTNIGRWMGEEADDLSDGSGGWGGVGVAKPLFVQLQADVEDALALIGRDTIDVFLWHQGESRRPNHESVEDYADDFNTLLGMLKAEDWWDVASTQFIAGECIIGTFYLTSSIYNDFFRSLNDNGDPLIKCVSGEGLTPNAAITLADSVHYDGQSLYELGIRYWRAYLGDAAALARRADPETTDYGVRATTLDWTDKSYGVAYTIDLLRDRVVEQKRPAPIREGGGREAGQYVGTKVGCAVTHNSDGTFTITYNSGTLLDWTFILEDYWSTWPGIPKMEGVGTAATITGKVDKTVREKFRLWLDGDTSAAIKCAISPNLREGTLADDLVEIDWGDGTYEDSLSSAGTHSHTYDEAYTGWVKVYAPGASRVNIVIISDGKFRSSLLEFANLTQLTYLSIAADNEMYGKIQDLPDTLATLILQGNNICTWDFTGLPNLTTATLHGANTANAVYKFSEMKAGIRFNIRGVDRSSDEIDNILIALSQIKSWSGTKDVFLNTVGQGVRTSASDAAVAELTALGVTLNLNT